jgi:sulfur relay (sulfurtransferase) complex TusBCD TusD component (DsrE family)
MAMSDYFLIESRDAFECAEAPRHWELAQSLAYSGHRVRVFLVQNGVLSARRHVRSGGFSALLLSGVPVLADEQSLRERGIAPQGLAEGVNPAPLELVIDVLAAGARVLWH